jgi:predicted nucleic acid-binding protein
VKPAFADSSGFIAAFLPRERFHEQARAAWENFARQGRPLVTTDFVVSETLTHLRRRGGYRVARDVGDALLASRAIEIHCLSREQLDAAYAEFVRNASPRLSLCDAASFVLMREHRIDQAFTFDAHFDAAGFERVPAPMRA